MRSILFLFFVIMVFSVSAQKENIPTTESFTIEGRVKKEMTISLADLSSYKSYSIDSIVITNHLKERRSSLKKVKAVLLKDILDKIEIDETIKYLVNITWSVLLQIITKLFSPGTKLLTAIQENQFIY